MPDFEHPFILETDASDNCIGAALIQNIDGKEFPVAFFSRTMSQAEKKLCDEPERTTGHIKSG